MIRRLTLHLLAPVLLAWSCPCVWGQATIPAFPGAEGAGKFALGGRGGDVYVVTNLNNTGTGSLRNGITSASGPRIIVFGVSGTINLTSDLSISGKSRLTIAGQTAPEGGITLAGRGLRVDNSLDIVVQHLRVRTGDINTGPSYAPDTVSVTGSSRVVLDHISASWSTDEALSVTDFSQNVSVQWSMISEALHDSNHPEGEHGYGSLLRGRDISFHHNLYAHNWSRNPRPGSRDGSLLNWGSYDFVNNVIYNPGNKYGYGENEDTYLNLVGNYGVKGPDSSSSASHIFDSGGVRNRIYARDNYLDNNYNTVFQVLDGGPSAANTIKNSYTELASRQPILEIGNETSAPVALQQVLSYVGASAWRDAADKRVIDDVFNQSGGIIDSQSEVGGWPTLPSNTVMLDPDGLPDWWKIEKGLDPDNNNIGRQSHPDGSGYTYLEKYLHELNAAYLPRTQTPMQMVISTAFGQGADAQVSENFDVSSGSGNEADLNVSYAGTTGDMNEYTLLRFDLSQIERGTVTSAQLELTAFSDLTNRNVRIFGLLPDAASDDWIEDSVQFDGAPGLAFDGDSGTPGRDASQWLSLGLINTGFATEGTIFTIDQVALAPYLNQLLYREGNDATVTLAIERLVANGDQTRFASKEATHLASTAPDSVSAGTYAPRLLIEAIQVPNEGLDGDFDGDNDVDGMDYLWWQINDGSPESLALWEANYGTVEAPPLSAPAVVPEPGSAALLFGLSTMMLLARRRAQSA